MVYLLTGPVGAGKTTALWDFAVRLRGRDVACGGMLSVRVTEKGTTVGYDAFDISSGRRFPFLRTSGSPEPRDEPEVRRVGPYVLVPEGLEFAAEILRTSPPDELLIVDEFGPLELVGQGLRPAVEAVLSDDRRRTLIVVRKGLVEDFCRAFPGLHPTVFEFREGISGILEREFFRP